LLNCKKGLKPVIDDINETAKTLGEIRDGVKGFKGSIDKFADWLEGVTWWN
jgi:hypothetical protein